MSDRPPVAVVLAAGKGTRMKSARPKVLFEVLGRPIVQRVVDAAREAGCTDVVVVVGYEAEQVKAALDGVHFVRQPGMQGTGQAVQAAAGALDFRGRRVLVLPGDVPMMTAPTLRALLESHLGAITIGSMQPEDPGGYGRILRAEDGSVLRIVEHRDASEAERAVGEVNTSIYVFDGDFLFGGGEKDGAVFELETDNEQGEYLLTDVVGIATGRGLAVGASVISDAAEVLGVNDRAQLADLEATIRERINRDWMESGVSMDDPATTRIEESVHLATDVHLGAGVELRGSTRVGEGAAIGKGSVLEDVEVGPGATVAPYVLGRGVCIAAGAEIRGFTVMQGVNEKHPEETGAADRVEVAEGARIGPFSHLRQAVRVGSGGRVGNFVELKKTALGEEAKVNHLAYLGDADVGDRSNIGAGVITCNYDGFSKHQTRIGKEAFIGTDSHLVAPVRVGDGAYVATGTTVTRDVPADALAIGRVRQDNKKGYAGRIKAQLQARADRAKSRAEGGDAPSVGDGAESE
ncbi:MAG: NTP transferase domain-containing protein [Myxococcota bacterium]|nr:NTP transferase domain-containing protein [Myxococcota bacterium]